MAVVSQPFDRGASCPLPGDPDADLGEFWEEDSWMIMQKHNLSAFERNRTFLNLEGNDFQDLSFLTSADTDGDSRAVVAADFRNDGRMELLVRQVGGGPLLLFENRFPTAHYLKISLRGRQSNRLGIGARVSVHVGERTIVREMFPHNGFASQMASLVHVGLGSASVVDRLTIDWPSGVRQELTDVAADQHLVIEEGQPVSEVVVPGNTIRP